MGGQCSQDWRQSDGTGVSAFRNGQVEWTRIDGTMNGLASATDDENLAAYHNTRWGLLKAQDGYWQLFVLSHRMSTMFQCFVCRYGDERGGLLLHRQATSRFNFAAKSHLPSDWSCTQCLSLLVAADKVTLGVSLSFTGQPAVQNRMSPLQLSSQRLHYHAIITVNVTESNTAQNLYFLLMATASIAVWFSVGLT